LRRSRDAVAVAVAARSPALGLLIAGKRSFGGRGIERRDDRLAETAQEPHITLG
jgi:hypothetical protein